MGIALCLFFAAWFFSGAVLIYHPFPSLSQTDRLAQSSFIDFSRVKLSPKEAVKLVGSIELDRLRLIDLEGQPIYVLHNLDSGIQIIDAESGKILNLLKKGEAVKIAENFSGKSVMKIEGPVDYDQWIVPNRYDPYRPFYRAFLQDRDETIIYVSARTREVLQKTEAQERAWNYIGAIVHWIYPTLLRKNWTLWDQVVWWISLFAVMTTAAGLLLGIIRYRGASGENRKGISSPFKGWLRAHHILGMFVGIFVFTWIFSGWLSMDHGRFFSKPNPEPDQIKNFRSKSFKNAAEAVSLEALKSLNSFNEVEIIAVGGQVFVMGRNSSEQKLFKPLSSDSLLPTGLGEPEIIKAIKKAWPNTKIHSTYRPDESDVYGQLREGSLPKTTLRVVLDNPVETWVHIDLESGKIVSVMDKSRRLYRWLFNGLHSLDFPGLAKNRPLWDVLILSMLTVGFFFSITSVVVGWKRLFNS
jgi:hypothetical protein